MTKQEFFGWVQETAWTLRMTYGVRPGSGYSSVQDAGARKRAAHCIAWHLDIAWDQLASEIVPRWSTGGAVMYCEAQSDRSVTIGDFDVQRDMEAELIAGRQIAYAAMADCLKGRPNSNIAALNVVAS